jgi:probable phosphoglycerate mutase
MAILLLIRHGDNDVFKTRIAGRMPGVHLNSAGSQQAQALAQSLASAPITAIYSSPLERALETAAPLAANHHLEVIKHPGLIEVDYGRLQGRTYKQLKRLKLWALLHEQPSVVTFPEGECLAGVSQRVVSTLDALAGQYGDHSLIACVTHGDVIRLAVAHYLGIPLDHYQCFSIATASITTLALGKNRPQLLNLNQVNGLEWPKPPPEKQG